MRPGEQERELQRKLVDSIVFVAANHQPENWLPMKVTVIEYPEDENGEEHQRLAECTLKEIFESEECCMREIGTATDEPYGVSEIINKSLIEVWEKYTHICHKEWRRNAIAYLKANTKAPESIIEAFVDTQWNKEELFADNLKTFNECVGHTEEKELWIFTYSIDHFDRDILDEFIVDWYNRSDNDGRVRKMTVDEFLSLLNDEMFDDVHNWVRAIELPKNQ